MQNCTFLRGTGAGIRCEFYTSTPLITDCAFSGHAWPAIHCLDSSPTIVNCLIHDNHSPKFGGGIFLEMAQATIVNCTIVDNSSVVEGGGIHSMAGTADVSNCIIRENSPQQVVGDGLLVNYSNLEGGCAGEGNIDADPLFVDPDNRNYRIGPGSPCIDAADCSAVPNGLTTDLDGNPRFVDDPDTPDTGIGYPCVDMGPYEFQVQDACPADVNDDEVVNIDDLFEVLGHWGDGAGKWDVNNDGTVDIDDIFDVLADWGPC